MKAHLNQKDNHKNEEIYFPFLGNFYFPFLGNFYFLFSTRDHLGRTSICEFFKTEVLFTFHPIYTQIQCVYGENVDTQMHSKFRSYT